MTCKLKMPILILFFLFVATASAWGGAADVIFLEGREDEPIESSTIMVDVAANYVLSVSVQPSHGTITVLRAPNYLTYTPDLNYFGPDTFTISVRIMYEDPDVPPDDWMGVYNVKVLPVNDIPVANQLSASTLKNTPLSIVLTGSDPVEGSSIAYAVWSFPGHGILSDVSHGIITEEADQNIVYTPASGFVGTDTFSYVAFDGADFSYEAVANITVTDSNILTVSFLGEGSGTVYSIPAGIVCVPGGDAGCRVSFSAGGKVDLTQTVSGQSEFIGWSGACDGIGACQVTMDSAKTVTASYKVAPAKVRIDGQVTPYYTLDGTLNIIRTDGQSVRSKAEIFSEDVLMATPAGIRLKGGYTDDAFSARTATSVTVINGSLKIRQGKLTLERIVVR